MIEEAVESASAVLRAAVESGEVPGAALAVASVDGVVRSAAFGVTDVVSGRPVTVETPFCLASTTKPLTSLVLGVLLDCGSIDLDDPVDLPDGLLVDVRPPTVREVADHTAGLGIHHRFFYDDEREPVALEDAVATLGAPVWRPGLRWSYSNLGYAVLQRELERAGGAPLADLVEMHVRRPLGLTTLDWGGPRGPNGAAARHGPRGQQYPGYVTDHPAASEGWCGVTDLARLGLAQLHRSLLRPETHDLLVTPSAPPQPDGAAYALGWVTRQVGDRNDDLWVHAGRMGGVAAHLTLLPSAGLVIAALANVETDATGAAVTAVLGKIVTGYRPPEPVPGWQAGPAHRSMARRWTGAALLGGEQIDMVLDASSPTMTAMFAGAVRGAATALVAPYVHPERVAAHLPLNSPLAAAPAGSIGHLDLRPDGERLVGMLTFAQYPNEHRWRQGDAVSAAVVLDPD